MAKKRLKPAKTVIFKLEGSKDIKPKAFSAKEIGAIISALEESVKALAKARNPSLDDEHLKISLVEVRHQSAGFKFHPSVVEMAKAYIELAQHVEDGSLEKLPLRSLLPLREIQRTIIKKGNCVGAFISGRTRISTLDASTNVKLPVDIGIVGETVLYGRIERVGGSEPKIALRLNTGVLLSLDVTEDLAKQFASNLYTNVGLVGEATWSVENSEIVKFRVLGLTEFEGGRVDVLMNNLRGLVGYFWDEVENVDDYLNALNQSSLK